ncbi:hypothetical protein [Sulfuracidifex tepidarius]|nr:hypothetical protein [Sulfuracidifex tepidarius]
MKKNSGTGISLYLQWLSYLIPLVRTSIISLALGMQTQENIVRTTNAEYLIIPATEIKDGFITGFPVPGYQYSGLSLSRFLGLYLQVSRVL